MEVNWLANPDTNHGLVLIDCVTVCGLPPDTTIASLAETLKQDDAFDRWSAAEILGRFGPQAVDAVPALIDVSTDEKLAVRHEVVRTLGKIGLPARSE